MEEKEEEEEEEEEVVEVEVEEEEAVGTTHNLAAWEAAVAVAKTTNT